MALRGSRKKTELDDLKDFNIVERGRILYLVLDDQHTSQRILGISGSWDIASYEVRTGISRRRMFLRLFHRWQIYRLQVCP